MEKRIITDGASFPIQPRHIHIGKGFVHFWNAFDHNQTEISAYYVIRLCQKLGGWIPFTREQIEEVYRESGHAGFSFNHLVEPGQKCLNGPQVLLGGIPETVPAGGGWILLGTDKKYYLTDDFVTRCFQSSPARSTKSEPSQSSVTIKQRRKSAYASPK